MRKLLLPLLLLAMMTSFISASPTPPTVSSAHLTAEHREAADERDGRVWDMLRQESRSFISAILPNKMAARAHDVLWSAPLHERAAREERIPRYTVVAMAGPPMMQSHDTELLDAALAPAVAGDFGRKANGLDGGRRLVGGDDVGRRRPDMTQESELMPNSLTTDGEYAAGGAEKAQAMAGHFGQRNSLRSSGAASIGDEAAPSVEEVGRAPAGAAPPADMVSGLSSFPQTERVPYAQNVRDFEAEKKLESEQTALPTSPPLADEFTPPTYEEFPFDSLKMDSSVGGGPEQAQFIEQETGNGNSNEQMPFDTSNFPNFPKFSFQRESDQDAAEQPTEVTAFGHGGSDWLKQDQTGSQRPAEPETTRFPMFPGEQEPANGENMDLKDMETSMKSMESDQHEDKFKEMLKEQSETTASPMPEEMESGDISSATEDTGVPAIASDGKITSHAGGLPLAPVTENRNTQTPPTGPADNQFQNFRESGAYPDLSLVGFPSFPDIPGTHGSEFSASNQEAQYPSTIEDTDANMSHPQFPTEPMTLTLSSGEPQLGEFVHPDIFPEADLSPTSGDEFYARLVSDPTFQTPTAPDLSFSADTRTPFEFPELRTQFPLIEPEFSRRDRPEFPELRTRFPQPEADFSHTEPEFPELLSLSDEEDDAFKSFAEVADLNPDPAADVQVFTDEEKMNDRRAINYHSPAQFGSRSPASYNHFSKSSGDQFKNTFFKNDFNRVTTQRPTTPRVPELKRPKHVQRPHGPRHPQGPPRPYPYTPRQPAHVQHTTTTYRPAIFVNEGPKVNGEETSQEENTPTTPSTQKLSGQAFFPDRNNIPGYIPRPNRPRPHHGQPAEGYGPHTAHAEAPEAEAAPSPQDNRKIPGYILRPTHPTLLHRAPQGEFGGHVRPTSLPQQQPTSHQLPTAYAPDENVSGPTDGQQPPTYLPVDVSDMSSEDQPPTSLPEEDFSTTASDTSAPTAVTTLETAPPTSVDLTDPSMMAEPPSADVSTPPPTLPPTTQPPTTRAATRRPYTFPPFRRRTTQASAIDSGDATTSQFAPEFGTRITHRKPASSGSNDGARRRRPGGRRRPSGGAGSGRSSRRRPGARRRPAGGRRRTTTPESYTTTPAPYTTTPAPAEMTTVLPTAETTDGVFGRETAQQMVVDADHHGDMAEEFIEEQSFLEDATESSETVPEAEEPMDEAVGVFGYGEMPVDVMSREEAPLAPAPEEISAFETPVDDMMEGEVMSEDIPEQVDPVLTVSEEVHPGMQDEPVAVQTTQEELPSPDEMISEDTGNAEVVPEGVFAAEPNPETMGPVPVMPVLSEVSASTAELVTEGSPIVPVPAIDISENTDIYVPSSSEVSEGEAPVSEVSEGEAPVMTYELPSGIFQLQPAVPQTQQDEEAVYVPRSEEGADRPVTESFPLEEVIDGRDATDTSDALGTAQGSNILEERIVGPTAVSESRELSVEENSLGDFGTFPETDAGDVVDVTAVLRDELGDDGDEEVQTVEANFPVADAGPGDNFFAESLQSLDNVQAPSNPDAEFGPFSGPSVIDNGEETLAPSIPSPQQQMSPILTPEDRESGPELDDVIPPSSVSDAQMFNTEDQAFEMLEAAPSHTMNGMPMENNDQYPGMFGGTPTMMISDALVPEDSSGMPQMPNDRPEMLNDMPEMPSDMPEVPSDMPEVPSDMPEVPSDMPEMPSDMPEMPNDMLPHMTMPGMPMQEIDNSASPMMEDSAPEMTATTEVEDDMIATHSMMPEGEQQQTMPSNVMSQQGPMFGMSEGTMPMPQDAIPQDIMPFPQDSVSETINQSGESPNLSDMTTPSGTQTMNVPNGIPAFVEPVIEATEPVREGFGPPQTYSVIPEGEEPASDGGMLSDMTSSADADFQDFPGSVSEEAPAPEEDYADIVSMDMDTMAMPISDDIMSTGGFDIRGSFSNGIAARADEGELSEAAIPDDPFGADPQPADGLLEVNLPLDMVAQPTSETLSTAGGFPEDLSEGSLNNLDDGEAGSIESRISHDFYPSQEDRQMLQDEPSAGPEDAAAPRHEQLPFVADDSNMNGQLSNMNGQLSNVNGRVEDVDIRTVAEPVNEIEDVTLPSAMNSATESDAEVVDVVPEYDAPPAEEPDVRDEVYMQSISAEEDQEQESEGSPDDVLETQEQDQETDEQEQEGQKDDQENQEEEQEGQEQENQEENQEIQEENQETQEENQEIQEEYQEEDQELGQDQDPHTGYGPPHSDTIVQDDVTTDDVTEEGDVTAPVPETYEFVPAGAHEQDSL